MGCTVSSAQDLREEWPVCSDTTSCWFSLHSSFKNFLQKFVVSKLSICVSVVVSHSTYSCFHLLCSRHPRLSLYPPSLSFPFFAKSTFLELCGDTTCRQITLSLFTHNYSYKAAKPLTHCACSLISLAWHNMFKQTRFLGPAHQFFGLARFPARIPASARPALLTLHHLDFPYYSFVKIHGSRPDHYTMN